MDLTTRFGSLTRAACVLLVVIGLGWRLAPLFMGPDVLLRQPTEDGYLLLTVARNIAIGLGMSTADGTLPTNGVQPLITFLFAGCYWLVDGDKTQGVLLSLLLSVVIGLGGAWTSRLAAQRYLTGHARAAELSALVAACWFASPAIGPHTMNALETGLYGALVPASLFVAAPLLVSERFQLGRSLALGALLGATFLARNDAVFLIAAVCLTLVGAPIAPLSRERWQNSLLVGSVASLVGLPWMLSNWLRFGSIVPISGRAEGLGAKFAGNLQQVPAKLAEYASVFGGIPEHWETHPAVTIACSVLLLGLAFAARRAFRAAGQMSRRLIVATAIYALALCCYYGLMFGAKWFLSRYMLPLALPLSLLSLVTIDHLVRSITAARARSVAGGAVVALFGLGLGVQLFRYSGGRDEHMHFQVVEWVEQNVPRDAWVGAVQTGTLGYFHDRTINLDGKVNPQAIEIRERWFGKPDAHLAMPRYVIESQIEYLVDWSGIAAWEEKLSPHFRVLVRDEARNLGALVRTSRP